MTVDCRRSPNNQPASPTKPRRQLPVAFLLLCALSGAGSAQWLETKITLPDSLGGATGPVCLTADSSERFVYVGDLGGAVYVVDAEAGHRAGKVATSSPVFAVCTNPLRNKVYAANFSRDNVTVISCATNRAVATVPVGTGPRAFCYNGQNDKVYCANWNSSDLTIIDGASDSVITAVHVGEGPSGLCYNPASNRVFCAADDTVTVIDGSSNSVVALFEAKVGTLMCAIPASNKVYVSGGMGILVLEGTNGIVLDSIAVGAMAAMSYSPAANRLYVGCIDEHGTVLVIDGATDSLVGYVEVGRYISSVVCDTARNRVYVARTDATRLLFEVAVIDGVTDSVTARVRVSGDFGELLGSSRRGRMYCTGRDGIALSVIDTDPDSLLHIVHLGGSSAPMCYVPTEDKVYYSNSSDFGEVGAIDAATNSPVAQIPVGSFPLNLLYHAPSSKVYCLNTVSDNLSIIDPRSDTVVKTIAVGHRSNSMCSAPGVNKVYCGNGGGELTVVDCGGDTVVRTVQVPGGLDYMSYVSTTYYQKLYCGGRIPPRGGILVILDCIGDTALRSCFFMDSPYAVCTDSSGSRVYWATEDSLCVYDARADTLVTVIPWETGGTELLFVPGVDKVYCARWDGEYIMVVDVSADTVITRIQTPRPGALGYDRTTGLVYCGRRDGDKVILIDSRTDSIVDSLSPCANPRVFAMAPGYGRVYVGNSGNSFVPVIRSALPGVEGRTPNAAPRGAPRARLVSGNRPLVVTQNSDLLDASGRKLSELTPGRHDLGRYRAGVYFLRFSLLGTVHKLLLVR